ncbi:DUF4329 domain-containing protein [Asticcacaulis sp. AC466]|uniref:DUF4329 domain-containing protein n=1 Tax=Asticcacaulis sp. AC466 TaxID=1282362 RepID=UPI0009DE5D22|nr:DUF4329 domain-containing protein [Asticcacaulis sp. AC466]
MTEVHRGDKTSVAGHDIKKGSDDSEWHSHGQYTKQTKDGIVPTTPDKDQYNSDNFSGPDVENANDIGKTNPGYQSYVSGPGGSVRKYDSGSGQVTVVKKGNPDVAKPVVCGNGSKDLKQCVN